MVKDTYTVEYLAWRPLTTEFDTYQAAAAYKAKQLSQGHNQLRIVARVTTTTEYIVPPDNEKI